MQEPLQRLADHGARPVAEREQVVPRDREVAQPVRLFPLGDDEVAAGTVIIREGQPGDRFYVLLSGLAGVSQTSLGERGVIRAGEFFGEVALAMNIPRTATVTTMTPCVVASCDAAAFEELVRPIFADDGEAL